MRRRNSDSLISPARDDHGGIRHGITPFFAPERKCSDLRSTLCLHAIERRVVPLKRPDWLNRTVMGAGVASFFSDLGHEAVTSLLPSLLIAMNAPVYALGVIEGISDGASSFVKLLSGHFSDRLGKRREFSLLGYIGTVALPVLVAIASSWPVVLAGRLVGWIGRGLRGPPRDAILAKSVDQRDLGKAFGFHRAGDTLGAILGPLFALGLLAYFEIRTILLLTILPAFTAFLAFWLFVKERDPAPASDGRTLLASLRELSPGFRRYLGAVFLFGIADFSHTLLIAFAVVMLAPSLGFAGATAAAIMLYTLRNIVYAGASYPFGALGDRLGRRRMLTAGYGVAVIAFLGFALLPANLPAYVLLFSLCGLFIAAEDTLESAVAGELVEERRRGLGFGALATVNGIGDLLSSVLVGFIWAFLGYGAGFLVMAVIALLGTLMLLLQGPSGSGVSP